MINKELLELKNEFLKEIREIETKLDKKLEIQSYIFDTKNHEQEEKINLSIQKNEELYDKMINEKLKIDKITELHVSQKKFNDMLISHEMRINTLLTDNEKLTKNYDKIISDNLTVPGYIGTSCTYKNLSEYIQNNINEIQKIKNEKEFDKKLTEDVKNKLDNFMKNMLNLVDNSVTRCKQYTDNKQVYLENILKNKLVEFDEKNMELRTQIFTNFSRSKQKIENFESKFNELKGLKEEISNEMEIKFKEIQISIEESKTNINKNLEEFIKYKNTIKDLIDKKLELLNKNQKNNKSDFKLNKTVAASPNIKSFRDSNKREELMNTFNMKSTSKNLNIKKNENIIRTRGFKRYTLVNEKSSKKLLLETKELKNEENKTLSFEKSDELSGSSQDINMINKNDLTSEVNKEKEKEKEKEIINEKVKEKVKKKIKVKEKEKVMKNKENEKSLEKLKEIKEENRNKDQKISNKIKEIQTEKNRNNEYILEKVENKNNTIYKTTDTNENKLNNSDSKNINIIHNNYNNASSFKTLNSFYVNNIKTKIEQKPKNLEINTTNHDTIEVVKENKIKIPKIIANLKNKENKTFIKKFNLINNKKKLETRNNISKSTNNTYNYINITKEKEKENEKKELKSINSERSIFEKKKLYNTSPKFYSIETQTPKFVIKNNSKKSSFPKIGFSYKIINLGSDINFNRKNIEKCQENSKMNIDLSNPLTNTYKSYQKKKNEKKYNIKINGNDIPIKGTIFKQNIILPVFNNNLIINNSSYNKNAHRSIDYEYIDLKKKKNGDNEHSIESSKNKLILGNNIKQ